VRLREPREYTWVAKTKAREEGATMKIIGCDSHPSYQQIAMVDTETAELREGRLEHEH
jgi:hypothetical protein